MKLDIKFYDVNEGIMRPYNLYTTENPFSIKTFTDREYEKQNFSTNIETK